jgi:hypothetical protein
MKEIEMLAVVGILAVLVVAATILLAALKPDDLHVERSILIMAQPREIFPLVNNLKAWEDWTPYDRDPDMERGYSGPLSGSGARYAWNGNREAGQGSITISKSVPFSRICLELNVVRPVREHSKAVFHLRPVADGTEVVWALDDKTPFAGKVMSLFVNLDRGIGEDFEIGLGRLKSLAEQPYLAPRLREIRAG